MEWETEEYDPSGPLAGVDFTKHSYEYPETLMEPPATLGDYPSLRPMKDIMADWPQDDIDAVPNPFPETLLHFDYTDPKEVEAARLFRDAKLPFKFTNVPEVVQAGIKWTDEYLSTEFTSPSDHPPVSMRTRPTFIGKLASPAKNGTQREKAGRSFREIYRPSRVRQKPFLSLNQTRKRVFNAVSENGASRLLRTTMRDGT